MKSASEHDLSALLRAGTKGAAEYLPAINTLYSSFATRLGSKDSMASAIRSDLDAIDFLRSGESWFKYDGVMNSAVNVFSKSGKHTPLAITQSRRAGTMMMADSGGYQVAKGVWDIPTYQRLLPGILDFQLTADVAICADVPSEAVQNGFVKNDDKALEIYAANMELFATSIPADAKTCFLSVLQGHDHDTRDKWSEVNAGFSFSNGLAISFRAFEDKFFNVLIWLCILHSRGALKGCRHIHMLGVGHLRAAIGFTLIARALRKHFGMEGVRFTYDSSTPFAVAYNGSVIENWRFEKSSLTFDLRPVPQDFCDVGSGEPFPYITSPIGKALRLGDICVRDYGKRPIDSTSYALIMAHNLYVYISGIIAANRLIDHAVRNPKLYELPVEIYDFVKIVDQAFCKPDETAMINHLWSNRNIIEFFDERRCVTRQDLIAGVIPDLGVDRIDDEASTRPAPLKNGEIAK